MTRIAVVLLLVASAAIAKANDPAKPTEQSVLSFRELMMLSEQQREDYLIDLQEMLLETGAIPHVFGGTLVADTDGRRSRAESLLSLLSLLQSSALARGGPINDGCGVGYKRIENEWAPGVQICQKTELVRKDRGVQNMQPVTDENKCAANSAHVLVVWPRGSSCIRETDYETLKKKNLLATWKAHLSPESAKRTKRPEAEGQPPTKAQEDSSTQAFEDQKKKDAEAKRLAETLKSEKGIDPVKDEDLKNPKQCVVRDKKNSKLWQSEREAYLREPDKRAEALKTKTCIYAGWVQDFKDAKTSAGETDVKGTACVRPKSEVSFGELKVSCAKGQLVCNPLIFGIASMSGNAAKGICANPSSNATQQCSAEFDKARADKPTKRAQARRPANGAAPAPAPAVAAKPNTDDTGTAVGATKKFFGGSSPGLQEKWNEFGKKVADFCKAESKTRKLHCQECQVIGNRLAAARAGVVKSIQDERAPVQAGPNAPAKK